MTPDQLDILLQEGEGTMLEYKESLSASFARELVAMANTLGGRILLGVRDDGSVVGINDSNELRVRIQDIARNCDPPKCPHRRPAAPYRLHREGGHRHQAHPRRGPRTRLPGNRVRDQRLFHRNLSAEPRCSSPSRNS